MYFYGIGNTAFDDGHIEKLEGWIDTLDSVRDFCLIVPTAFFSTPVAV